ncbi:hypothetical protein F5X96DRAFT_683138 [Biscogniauxia mediterranea]|nr:hypothetical protein F5X96DRAFT_683138 [Biscogniauxia mediterranea]
MPSVTEEFVDAFDVLVWQHEKEEEGEESGPAFGPKGKEKANELVTEIDNEYASLDTCADHESIIDWTKYEPPDGLKDVSDVHSELVANIIQDSIKNVKARIIEEERRKAEVEKLKQEEEEAQKDREKGKEAEAPETPIEADGPADATIRPPSPDRNPYFYAMTKKTLRRDPPPGAESTRPKKRSLMSIFRRLNHGSEKGETSAAGASRHKAHGSSASDELNTHAGRRKFVSELMKRRSTADSSPPPPTEEPEVECVSCLEDFSPMLVIKAPCHSYCPECFKRLVAAACDNEQQWPPKCCLNAIPDATVTLHVDEGLKQRYRERAQEWSLAVGERVYCSEPTCAAWVRPHEVDRAGDRARCSAGHLTCTICRGRAHAGSACPQDRDLARTQELADEEGWKRCPGCRAFVEHREACQHMTCRCGAEFCYVCGERWRTCACTMEQLHAVKHGAEARREARRDREVLEEAEIQEALRLVEEFEREEALKAELLRQEQERLAEERRQRELEERIRREGERRKAVEAKFRELREVFSYLHELQRLLVQRDHDKEGGNLQGKHKAEREREKRLEAEYEARVAEERRIREQYHTKLQIYWAQKKNGMEKMDEALEELRGKLDKSFEKYRYNLMEAAERKLTETIHERQEEFEKRKGAELRWVRSVIEERERMLIAMEVDETENGEDIDAWFAEGGLDDVVEFSLQESDPIQEYRVPGAFED